MKIHGTAAWRKLSKQVIAEEPICWLRLPGCTARSDTTDHIIPTSLRPDLALLRSNCRGACKSCNNRRGVTPVDQLDDLRRALGQDTKPAHPATALNFFEHTRHPAPRTTHYALDHLEPNTWAIRQARANTPQRRRKPPPAEQLGANICPTCLDMAPLSLPARSKYCSSECATEANARANRERYRREQGLPPTLNRPRKPHARLPLQDNDETSALGA